MGIPSENSELSRLKRKFTTENMNKTKSKRIKIRGKSVASTSEINLERGSALSKGFYHYFIVFTYLKFFMLKF